MSTNPPGWPPDDEPQSEPHQPQPGAPAPQDPALWPAPPASSPAPPAPPSPSSSTAGVTSPPPSELPPTPPYPPSGAGYPPPTVPPVAYQQPNPYHYGGWPPPPGLPPRRSRLALVAGLEAVAILILAVALIVSIATRPRSSQGSAATSSPQTAAPVSSPTTAVPYSATSGPVVYTSKFAPSDGWNTGPITSDERAEVRGSGYVVTGSGRLHHLIVTPYVDTNPGMSLTAAVTSYPGSNVSFGVGCQSTVESSYYVFQFIVYPNGDWYLEEALPNHSVTTLQQGTGSHLAASATVGLSCVSDPPAAGSTLTTLVGYVNGVQQVQFGAEQSGLDSAGWVPVMLLDSYGTTVSATFTSITVRKLPAGT